MPEPERALPSSDRFAVAPPADVSILEFYAGVFEAVYVLLNPFIRPKSLGVERFNPQSYPDYLELAKGCEPVRWAVAAEKAGLPSITDIDIGLRTRIHGLRDDLSNKSYAEKMNALIASQGIVPPCEGRFPELLYAPVLTLVQALGYEWVWIGDEFGTERKLEWIDDLKKDPQPRWNYGSILTPDKAFLWTNHWDSHFTFLCSSRANLDRLTGFEGFFCDQDTQVYWSVNEKRNG